MVLRGTDLQVSESGLSAEPASEASPGVGPRLGATAARPVRLSALDRPAVTG